MDPISGGVLMHITAHAFVHVCPSAAPQQSNGVKQKVLAVLTQWTPSHLLWKPHMCRRAAISMSDTSDRDVACALFDTVKGNSASSCQTDSVDLSGVRGL